MDRRTELIDLLTASPVQRDRFRSMVGRFNGVLPVLTHPDHDDEPNIPGFYTIPEYPNSLDNYLLSLLQQGLSPLVLNPKVYQVRFFSHLQRLGGGEVFTVTTYPNGPLPIGGESEWEELINIMWSSGVHSVDAGGKFMANYKTGVAWKRGDNYRQQVIERISGQRSELIRSRPLAAKWLSADIIPTGCAGAAACKFLLSGFDVALSMIATPCRETEYFPINLRPLREGEET